MSLGIFQLSLVNVCSVYIFHCCRCMELETFKKKMQLHTISSIQFLIARYIHYVDINITSVMKLLAASECSRHTRCFICTGHLVYDAHPHFYVG